MLLIPRFHPTPTEGVPMTQEEQAELLESYGTTLVPELEGGLRTHNVKLPPSAQKASGIRVLGQMIRSIVYTTDIAIIRNCNADAVWAVYPFTPQQVISEMLVKASSIPVFVGVGGGTTTGSRCAVLASQAEAAGAYGVILNAPASYTTLEMVSRIVDIPVIVTVIDDNVDVVRNRLESGATAVNVAGGKRTPEYVANLRAAFPDLPIVATGGTTDETVAATVAAGANSVIFSPPSNKELFSAMMEHYREEAHPRSSANSRRPPSKASTEEMRRILQRLRESGLLEQ